MKKPKVSVLLSAHNAEEFLGDAIDSILRQTFTNFELLILDDASTDSTWKIIKQYKMADNRIRIYRTRKNMYIANARNKLAKMAKGKYIAWQDADDISLPERISKQSRFLDAHPQVGIVGGYLEFFNKNGPTGVRKYAEDDKTLRKYIFRISPVAEPSAMIRAECFKKVGYYNSNYPPAHDIEMSFRIGTKYKFANLPEVLIRYRIHQSSATFNKLKKMESDTINIRKKFSKNKNYKMSIIDRMYNFVQGTSLHFMSPRFRIWLFNKLRNSQA